MTELGIIASVVQIADVGLRLSIKLYTFGEIVASADRSVISISKDVSLTSGVLKELGQLLDKDKETGTFSETAVQTADGVVKECLEVFKEMDKIIVKRLPSLGAAGKGGGQGERAKRATVMLERLKWGYLQPKLELLRSNLDSLKSTLLLMLNVITYARQVSEKAELPSVIAEQKCLIEDLAQSNQEYILKFERLKLGIEEPAGGPVDDAAKGGVVEMEPRKSLSGTLTRKLKKRKIASLQDKESTRGLRSEESNKATWPSPKAQSSTTGSLATPPNADTDNININTSVRGNSAIPPVIEWGIPPTEAPMAFGQEALFKQLEHHSMLIKNLLKEVDEAQYKITLQSRWRMRGGIEGLHEGEKRDLEKMWGLTALQSAQQRLDSLKEGIGELPRVNSFAAPVASAKASPSMADNIGTSRIFADNMNRRKSGSHPKPEMRDNSAMLSTYAGDTTHGTHLPSDSLSYPSVRRARPLSTSERPPMESGYVLRRRRAFPLHSPIENYAKVPRSYTNNARLHHQPRNDVDEHGANAFDNVDEGDTEGLDGKISNGEGQIRPGGPANPLVMYAGYDSGDDSGDSTASSLPARRASALLAPAPQAPAKFEPQIEQGESQLANEDLVDRLISLWTTVKP